MTEKKKPGRQIVATDPNLDDSERAAVKAVKSYETTVKTLEIFEAENEALFETYRTLLEEREQKRQVADAAVRSAQVSFGPWKHLNEAKKYKPDILYERIGEAKFLEIGGTIKKETVYVIDKKQIELALAARKIPAKILPDIVDVSQRYSAPKAPGKSE